MFRFVDMLARTVVFQSFHPAQLVQNEEDEYLISIIETYLKSNNLPSKFFEDQKENRDAFYKIFVGFTITPLNNTSASPLINSSSSNSSHSYLIEILRYTGNTSYRLSAVSRHVDSNLFFSYFRYQLKRLLSHYE